jgi:dTDP-4-dehydrorhamnose reductase
MIVLVVGRKGQLARAFVEARSAAGIRVVTVGRPELDLLRPEGIAQALDRVAPDIVVNTAGYTAVDRAERESKLAFAVNSEGVGCLAAACAVRGAPIIHLSTDYVYDGTKHGPYVEGDAVNPVSVYGRSKLAGEQNLAAANPRHIILRTAWVYAPFGTNFVRTMLRVAATRKEIAVVNDQHGNPTYAPHLVKAIISIIEKLGGEHTSPWGVYHSAGTGETTWFGFAQEIFRCHQGWDRESPIVRPISTAEYSTPASRPPNSQLNTDKLARTFGVRLPLWQDGVAECVQRLNINDAPDKLWQ